MVKNLVYIIHGTFNSAGMERIIINKANYLQQTGNYNVYIVTTEQKGRNPYYKIDRNIKQVDLDICFSDYQGKNLLFKGLSFIKKYYLLKKRLLSLLTRINAKIVISTCGHEIYFLWKFKRNIPDVKLIVESHFSRDFHKFMHYNSSLIERKISSIRIDLEKKVLKKYDKFIVLTQDTKYDWNLPNCEVIPNFLDVIDNSCANLMTNRCIAVGRLEPQKDYFSMIEIFSEIHKKAPLWKLDIFGNGTLESEITDTIKEKNLENVIIIHQPTNDIRTEYLNSSIFILTSKFEGFPMVLIEAQSFGLPIVSYNCKSGPSEVIDQTNGRLIQMGDKEAFCKAFLDIANNISLRTEMGKNAKINSYNYSKETIMKKWIEVFEC